MSRQITEAVQQLARPIVEKEGLELVDIEYKKEGPNWFLRIFIDREDGGVDLDDCTRISEIVGKSWTKKTRCQGRIFWKCHHRVRKGR